MMTIDELKKLDVAALKNETVSLRKELFNLKLGRISGGIKDTSQFNKLRIAIAQTLTMARQKEQAAKQQAKK
jgi:ribosomal protein L29